MQPDAQARETLITLTSDIVAAHVSNNSVAIQEVPTLIENVFQALAGLGEEPEAPRVFRRQFSFGYAAISRFSRAA